MLTFVYQKIPNSRFEFKHLMRLYFDCKYLDIVLFLSEYFLIHEQNISHSYLYDETALKSLLLFDFDRNLTVKYGMF